MKLSGLLSALRALPEYQSTVRALTQRPRPSLALNLPRAARLPVIAALAEDWTLGGAIAAPILVLTARAERAASLVEELNAWVLHQTVWPFNEPNPLFYELSLWGPRTIRARIGVLQALAAGGQASTPLIVASARALMTRTLPKQEFIAHTHTLRVGETLHLSDLLDNWVGIGYSAETTVIEAGQFARRGGIIDIYPLADELPTRIELFGDEIETLRHFEPATQRSGEGVTSVTITPAREALPKYKKEDEGQGAEESVPAPLEFQLPLMFPPASLLEYLPENALVLIDDWQELTDTVSELEEQAMELREEQVAAGLIAADFPLPYHTWADLQDELAQHTPVLLSAAADPATAPLDLGLHFHAGPRYGGQLKPLLETLHTLRESADRIVIVTRQAQRLAELWGEQAAYLAPVDEVMRLPEAGAITFVAGSLHEGWLLKEAEGLPDAEALSTLHLLTDTEIFGWAKPEFRRRHARRAAGTPEANYADFTPGGFVVHADFGVGRFRELVRRAVEGMEREYLLVEFSEGDELYVPIHQTDRLTRYVGADDHPPALSRLGSAEWQGVKDRARQAAEEVAKELLELYAQRELAPGRAFKPDTAWQQELEASFPYVETEDQLRAIREVKADMERPRPMDRLICGDVGYGKTEVALRAAFKAVMDGTQVAVLVPTTVLAQQHWHTFQTRLAPYPLTVEMLSRFRTPAEAKAILQKLSEGKVDILIGTHRLLQKDVVLKNLGLLIIDEEQRFGVTHKERLKKMRTEVDVLTLTATPIPRTLYMSLTGVRDISTINTPPEERLPIITHTGAHDDRLVRQAILRELDRDGQIFYVHNRVQSIGAFRQKLEQLVPEARVGVGHGQMDEHELSHVMDQFTSGDIDILLCTSIIESGLDIPNANTLIVDRADTFGLAQLYQLRGRVGRGAARAYAYFFTDRRHRPTVEARERLDTLAEQTDLGAGYSIAMRDLEMRGAGDILGARQSGHIAAVGFHLYTRLLAQAVKRFRGQAPKPTAPTESEGLAVGNLDWNVSVDLPLSISLPASYVDDQGLRLQLYRRMANLSEERDILAIGVELADRFGPLPPPVENLIYQLRVKVRALKAGVEGVASDGGQMVLTLPMILSETDQGSLAGNLGPGVRVSKNKVWLMRAASEKEWKAQLLEVLDKLAANRPTWVAK
jgi:transcription-repair coupling factor (superfamily II helicase)